MAEAVDSMGHGRNGPWPAARLPTTCSSACPPTACWSPRISSTPGPTSVWPVVLSVGGVWSGGVAGAVQEYRGDERGGFLDAGLVVGGQAGRGPEQAAERDCELVDGEVAAERPVASSRSAVPRPRRCQGCRTGRRRRRTCCRRRRSRGRRGRWPRSRGRRPGRLRRAGRRWRRGRRRTGLGVAARGWGSAGTGWPGPRRRPRRRRSGWAARRPGRGGRRPRRGWPRQPGYRWRCSWSRPQFTSLTPCHTVLLIDETKNLITELHCL